MKKGWLSEIFDSIQGEGIYAGVRQIFLRFGGCNLRCSYCDTTQALRRREYCLMRGPDGDARFKNPLSIARVLGQIRTLLREKPVWGTRPTQGVGAPRRAQFGHGAVEIRRFCPGPKNRRRCFHSVSLTGGEPLLQVDYLEDLIPRIRRMGFRIYLETNGTLPDALRRVVRKLDFIAMDIKLPSAVGKGWWGKNEEFLKIGGNKVFVKVVIEPATTRKEIGMAVGLVAAVNRKIPLVLQPVTLARRKKQGINTGKIIEFQELAFKKLDDVRIIPQIHKLLGFI